MKILLPIVGSEQADKETQYIKNLYEIERKSILQYVYESLKQIEGAEFIVIIRRKDILNYHLDDMIRLLIPNVKIIIADGATSGAACSCLLAVDEISEEEPLIIAGGDQLVTRNLNDVVLEFIERDYDGGVVIFDDIHPRWSFVKLDENNLVIEAAEKRPISRNATTGFYYFKRGKDFVESAEQMIKKGASVNGQYYVCPSFNQMVLKNRRIGVYRIDKREYFNFNKQKGIEEYEKYLKEGIERVRF